MKTNFGNLGLGMFLMASAAAHAQQLPQLPQFQPNTPAKAADVNANFETLRGKANSNEGRVTPLEGVNAGSRLTTLEGVNAAARITALEAQNAALTAQLAASVACPANTPTRFTDKGDGTVCDSQTGLMWEIKTGTVGAIVTCSTPVVCLDPHDVNNYYTWSAATPFTEPTGTLYSNFLERLNDLKTANDGTATPCFAGHCDWRVPTIGELRSILQAPNPNCTANPCIAAGFPGPTLASVYWSSSSLASVPAGAWWVAFDIGIAANSAKNEFENARAVRGGR